MKQQRVHQWLIIMGLALGVVCIPLNSAAQDTGSIKGTITDDTGAPLPGVNIYISALERGTSTDAQGTFSIANVMAGSYSLRITYMGMASKTVSVIIRAGQTENLNETLVAKDSALEEIVVQGSPIRSSQVAAIARQKNAPVVMNVVASDQVGKFPDQNAAAALARIPGVAVERDQGQARYINLRGMLSRWTSLAIDGVNIIGSEGRVVRFDEIPAPIIQTIEVSKVIAPNNPAESIAGRANIQTRSAFDRPGMHAFGEFAPGYFELSENTQYNASLGLSTTWGQTVGVSITASRYLRNQVTNNIESDFAAGLNGALFPTQADYRVYYLQRQNNGLSGRVDFKPNERNAFFFTGTYVSFQDDEQRNQYILDFDAAAGGFANNMQNTPPAGPTAVGTVTRAAGARLL